jgi:hypothetical protein
MSKIKVISDAVNQLSDSLSKNLETEKKNITYARNLALKFSDRNIT